MANIDVVKKSSYTWLWILIAVVIVIALFFLFRRNPETRTGFLNHTTEQPHSAAPLPAHLRFASL